MVWNRNVLRISWCICLCLESSISLYKPLLILRLKTYLIYLSKYFLTVYSESKIHCFLGRTWLSEQDWSSRPLDSWPALLWQDVIKSPYSVSYCFRISLFIFPLLFIQLIPKFRFSTTFLKGLLDLSISLRVIRFLNFFFL